MNIGLILKKIFIGDIIEPSSAPINNPLRLENNLERQLPIDVSVLDEADEDLYNINKNKKDNIHIGRVYVHDGYNYYLSDKYSSKLQEFFDNTKVKVKVVFERYANPYEVMIVWDAKNEKEFQSAFKDVSNQFESYYALEAILYNQNMAVIKIGEKKGDA